MKSQHAKSPCCGARIYRHLRRRRCSCCGKSWRIRRKRRGRRPRRLNPELLDRVLLANQNLQGLAQRSRLTRQTLSYRFRRLLLQLTTQLCPNYPEGRLVLLIDGLWFRFQQRPWVLYLVALKPCGQNRAVFVDPVLLPGREQIENWREVLGAIPLEVRQRIVALVADNLRGVKGLALQNRWTLQLCQFHLISQLQGRRGRVRSTVRGRKVREALYQLTRQALEAPDGPELEAILKRLRRWVQKPVPLGRMGMVVRSFLRDIDHYRAYRRYPEYGLPTTTNAVESMGRIIRDLMRRARNFSTPETLRLWVIALLRRRPEITCNGKIFTPNYFV
jgi:hypothetical protein